MFTCENHSCARSAGCRAAWCEVGHAPTPAGLRPNVVRPSGLLVPAPVLWHRSAMTTLHDFTVNTIDGAPKKLSDFSGKALLVVNVASRCGLTPQYTALEELYRRY